MFPYYRWLMNGVLLLICVSICCRWFCQFQEKIKHNILYSPKMGPYTPSPCKKNPLQLLFYTLILLYLKMSNIYVLVLYVFGNGFALFKGQLERLELSPKLIYQSQVAHWATIAPKSTDSLHERELVNKLLFFVFVVECIWCLFIVKITIISVNRWKSLI